MSDETVRFAARVETVFIEEGFDPSFFVTLPEAALAEVAACRLATGKRGAFGMVKVTVRIGESNWKTTVNAKDGGYFLTIRKPVRLAEDIAEGQQVDVELQLA